MTDIIAATQSPDGPGILFPVYSQDDEDDIDEDDDFDDDESDEDDDEEEDSEEPEGWQVAASRLA